jgi:hypothetical protein
MLSVPSATFTPEQQAANRDQGNWLLKNLLMTGGMVAGGALTGGVAPMILGAAGGRMLARVPEVALEHTMGRGKSFGDEAEGFLDEGATGAMEGLEGELGARAAGPALAAVRASRARTWPICSDSARPGRSRPPSVPPSRPNSGSGPNAPG